jgi:NADP-dependent 3-hydroxy acid dehydrogenase YdfG
MSYVVLVTGASSGFGALTAHPRRRRTHRLRRHTPETVSDVADRIRAEFYDRIGFSDLLSTRTDG